MIADVLGSFGSTILKCFLTSDIGQIRIFSMEEKKHDDLQHVLQAKYPEYASKVKFYIKDMKTQDTNMRDWGEGIIQNRNH